VITKDFGSYKRIILRQDKTLRDHGRSAMATTDDIFEA